MNAGDGSDDDKRAAQPRLTSHELERRGVNLRLTRTQAQALLRCASDVTHDTDAMARLLPEREDRDAALRAMQALDASLRDDRTGEGGQRFNRQRERNREGGRRRDGSGQGRNTRPPLR